MFGAFFGTLRERLWRKIQVNKLWRNNNPTKGGLKMITWRDVAVSEIHRQELLKEAEKNQLVRQLRGNRKNAVWQQAKASLASLFQAGRPNSSRKLAHSDSCL
jgi:hypothetical protein